MSAEEKIEELMKKNWNELTEFEKEFVVKQLGSADIFHTMKVVNSQLQGNEALNIKPRPATLTSLKTKLKRQHGRASWVAPILQTQISALATVACILIALAFGWYWGKSIEKPAITHTIVETDTIYIKLTPDTIIRTKVVYKWIAAKKTPVITAVTPVATGLEPNTGVSMKDKEELESFIVSGTE